MLSLFLSALLLASDLGAAEQQQQAITKTANGNPKIAASIQSIFSSISSDASTTDSTPDIAWCFSGGAIGVCNDFFYVPTPTVAAGTASRTTALPVVASNSACCTAGCADGSCRKEEIHRHHPGKPMLDTCSCWGCCPSGHPTHAPFEPGAGGSDWWPRGCVGRICGAPTAKILGELTSIYPTPSASTHDAEATGGAVIAADDSYDPTLDFHAVELAGSDQDTIGLVFENGLGEAVTLLADVDLTLTENYISSAMLAALGISSTSSQSSRMATIAKSDQRVAILGPQALEVRPRANVSLNFLTGPQDSLKHFVNVDFNVFDLPPSAEDGSLVWQPELYLGVVFVRDARALRLAEGFAGNPAIEGVPVLVRSMKGYAFSSGGDTPAGSAQEDWEKDEL